MIDLNKLNPYQKEAVLDESPACLVNANVGSGKTTVLTAKVRYLCEQKGVDPRELMVLTFTNKAANEIRERLEDLLGTEENLWFGTFHSVALRMLQTILPVEELGYTKEFQVCIPEEEMQMAQQLIAEQNLQIKYKNRLKKRLEQSRQKNGRKPKDYGDDFDQLCTLLEEEKKKQNKMTYEELILHTGLLLRSHPEISRPQWLIIDEVQDCDQCQLDLLDSLLGKDSHLFAVGDPNQVIYSWRGSAFQIFFQLKNRYQARQLTLPINYRSSGTILSVARRFLQNGSQLEGVKDDGGKVRIRKQYDPFQEAEDLAVRIREIHMQGIPYHEIGILYRLQNQSSLLEQVFTRNGIPVHVAVKEKMEGFSNKEAVKIVTTKKQYTIEGSGKHVAIIDFGIKANIIRNFKKRGCKITVFPMDITAEEVLAVNPDLIFLSNGPGDPEDLEDVIENIKELIGKKPIVGICLGHQILARVFGGKTGKLKFGHRGGNHPVKEKTSVKIFPLIKDLFTLSFPISLNRILLTLLGSIEAVLIPQMLIRCGMTSSEALKIYGIFTGMALPLLLFPSTLTTSAAVMLMPSVARMDALGDQKQIRHVTDQTFFLCMFLGFLCGSGFFLFGPFLGTLLFHSKTAGTYIRYLSFICPFLYTNTMLASILQGLGRPGRCLIHSAAGILIRIFSVVFMIPAIGIRGYFYGIFLGELLLSLLHVKALKFPYRQAGDNRL